MTVTFFTYQVRIKTVGTVIKNVRAVSWTDRSACAIADQKCNTYPATDSSPFHILQLFPISKADSADLTTSLSTYVQFFMSTQTVSIHIK